MVSEPVSIEYSLASCSLIQLESDWNGAGKAGILGRRHMIEIITLHVILWETMRLHETYST